MNMSYPVSHTCFSRDKLLWLVW